MRVLIADDHPFVRKGIREVLAEELGIRDIVETSDGLSAYDLLVSERFDLAVIDISMPGKDGLELMKDVLALRPTVPFLVMSVHPEQELAERAYQCGAKGYLGKLRPLSEFVEAARRILAGGVYVNPALAQTLVERLRAPREKKRPRPAYGPRAGGPAALRLGRAPDGDREAAPPFGQDGQHS